VFSHTLTQRQRHLSVSLTLAISPLWLSLRRSLSQSRSVPPLHQRLTFRVSYSHTGDLHLARGSPLHCSHTNLVLAHHSTARGTPHTNLVLVRYVQLFIKILNDKKEPRSGTGPIGSLVHTKIIYFCLVLVAWYCCLNIYYFLLQIF
jgi:hypothetical protein